MNRSLFFGAMLGVALVSAGGVWAGYKLGGGAPASGVSSTAAESVSGAPTVASSACTPAQPGDKHRIAGSVVGGLVGGAVGKDVGHHGITTAAGVAVGAVAGNEAEKKFQEQRAKRREC
jgi:uncharacterized protein YcfJ